MLKFYRLWLAIADFGETLAIIVLISNCRYSPTGCPTGVIFYKINYEHHERLILEYYQFLAILKISCIFKNYTKIWFL